MDNQQSTDGQLRELALFAGAGGGILAGKLLGWRTVCAVEIEPYPASVLLARQNDGLLPPFPVWDDIRTFDGRPWRGIVDVVSGGFPCQDISVAGTGAGIDGERSGLWAEMARIIREVQPRFAFVENSPALTSRGLGRVLGDLAEMGFDAEWGVLGADDAAFSAGNPQVYHGRRRLWIVATRTNSDGLRKLQQERRDEELWRRTGDICKELSKESSDANDKRDRRRKQLTSEREEEMELQLTGCLGWWDAEPGVGRVVNGLAARAHRIKAIGNGQVPHTAAMAFRLLRGRLS